MVGGGTKCFVYFAQLLTAVTALEPALIASAGTLPSAPSPLFPHTLAGVSTGNERGLARAAAVF